MGTSRAIRSDRRRPHLVRPFNISQSNQTRSFNAPGALVKSLATAREHQFKRATGLGFAKT